MKKISRFCLFSLSLVLICGLCACAPDIEKPEGEVSFSSSGLQSSGPTRPQEEISLSSLPESTPFVPESRSWKVVFMGVEKACCKVTADGEEVAVKVSYDKAIAALTVEVPETAVGKEIVITFADGISLAENDLAGRCYAMLDKAQIPYNLKSAIQAVVEKMGKDGIGTLATMNLSPALMGAVLELLTA